MPHGSNRLEKSCLMGETATCFTDETDEQAETGAHGVPPCNSEDQVSILDVESHVLTIDASDL
jgi:hypothetical protein